MCKQANAGESGRNHLSRIIRQRNRLPASLALFQSVESYPLHCTLNEKIKRKKVWSSFVAGVSFRSENYMNHLFVRSIMVNAALDIGLLKDHASLSRNPTFSNYSSKSFLKRLLRITRRTHVPIPIA